MRKTKIIATIGPACDTEELIAQMIEAGTNVFRFNMKHSDVEWHSERMERIERVCKKLKRRVAMLIDLQGPEVRIDSVPDKWAAVQNGDVVKFTAPGKEGITLDHPEVFELVRKGQTIYADDGFLEFMVKKVGSDWMEAEVVEGGPIKARKTVNFPGAHLTFAALVEKDLENLSLAARHHVDFVALSFVRSANDIKILQKELEKLKIDTKIIAKIEHPDAIEHFDEILEISDGIMVARGDLGIEYPLEEVPSLQKMIVRRAREWGKPVIIATQMLESMITNPRPTRAEVSDVANAVYDSADAVMLSAESATGAYPIRSVKTLARITERVEEADEMALVDIDWAHGGQTAAVVAAANKLMDFGYKGVCDLKAFVVLTETGRTANYLSRMRPKLPIYGMTGNKKTLDQMQLSWGVIPVPHDYSKNEKTDIAAVVASVKASGVVEPGDKVVMIYGEIWGKPGLTSVVRVQEIV